MKTPLENKKIINDRYLIDMQATSQNTGYISYFCTDTQTNSSVLIKEFFPDYAKRDSDDKLIYARNQENDMNEFNTMHMYARKFGTLPTVVSVYDIFTEKNTLYAVCEYTNGTTVSKTVAKGSDFTFTSVQRMIVNMLKTNLAISKFGMYHTNFAPQNVLIIKDLKNPSENGGIKLKAFLPESAPDSEKKAIKSLCSLAYFMICGKELDGCKKAPSANVGGNMKRISEYVKYVYFNDNIVINTQKFLEDALKNFDVKLSSNFEKIPRAQARSKPAHKKEAAVNIAVKTDKGSKTDANNTLTLRDDGKKSPHSDRAKKKAEKIASKKKSGGFARNKAIIISMALFALVFTGIMLVSYAFTTVKNFDTSVENIVCQVDEESIKQEFETSSDAGFIPKEYHGKNLEKDFIGEAEEMYLEIGAKSDCTIDVRHENGSVSHESDGRYKVKLSDNGKIEVVSYKIMLFGLFKNQTSYSFNYTRKTFAKLKGLKYIVNNNGEELAVDSFNPEVGSCSIWLSHSTTSLAIVPETEKGIKAKLDYGNPAANSSGSLEITAGKEAHTIAVKITVTGVDKETNTYTLNVLVEAKPETNDKGNNGNEGDNGNASKKNIKTRGGDSGNSKSSDPAAEKQKPAENVPEKNTETPVKKNEPVVRDNPYDYPVDDPNVGYPPPDEGDPPQVKEDPPTVVEEKPKIDLGDGLHSPDINIFTGAE